MARPLRIEYPGAFYHVVSRGNARQKIFLSDQDKVKFLFYLENGVDPFGYKVHAYCLMDNHYHLLLETQNANLSKILQRLNSSYTTYFSRKRKRVGHLLQGRPKVLLIDKDSYALELSRYIHLNPVKARIVARPEAYGWSSYVYYFRKLSQPPFLETSFLLGQFGKSENAARKEMRKFVEAGRTGKLPNPFRDQKSRAILGSEDFVHWVQNKYLRNRKKDRELPGLRELKRLDIDEIRKLVEHSIMSDSKLARKVTVYLCRKYSERSLEEIGEFFGGVTVSAISQIVRRLESQRLKNKPLDRQLRSLEKKVKMSNV